MYTFYVAVYITACSGQMILTAFLKRDKKVLLGYRFWVAGRDRLL